jgi:hypothetical protein
MPKRGDQGLQGEIGSQRYHPRTLDDLVNDLVNFLGAETETCSPAQQSPSQLIQDLNRENKVTLAGDILDQLESFLVLDRIRGIKGINKDVGVDQDAVHALRPRP